MHNLIKMNADKAGQNTSVQNDTRANSAFAQRQRIAEWFKASNSLTTEDARRNLDIMHPAGRIRELRARGFEIMTVWENYPTVGGNLHRMARYVFMGMRGRHGE